MEHYNQLTKQIADILKVPTAYFYAADDNLAEFIRLFESMNIKERVIFLKENKSALSS